MGKKRSSKISLNNDNVKRLDIDQVKISEKDVKEFTAKNDMQLDYSSDDSDNIVVQNIQVSDKMASTQNLITSSTKMADKKLRKKPMSFTSIPIKVLSM